MQVDSQQHSQRTMLQDTDFQKTSADTQHTFLLGHLLCFTISTCFLAFPPGTKNIFGDCWADTWMQLACHLHLAIIFIATMNSMFTCPAFLEKNRALNTNCHPCYPREDAFKPLPCAQDCISGFCLCSNILLMALAQK